MLPKCAHNKSRFIVIKHILYLLWLKWLIKVPNQTYTFPYFLLNPHAYIPYLYYFDFTIQFTTHINRKECMQSDIAREPYPDRATRYSNKAAVSELREESFLPTNDSASCRPQFSYNQQRYAKCVSELINLVLTYIKKIYA